MSLTLQNMKQLLERLSIGQRLALGGSIVAVIAVLLLIAQWAAQPDYGLLFGRLDSTDANRVVEALQKDGITYELRDGGAAVYVPREQVYELRLRFAAEGLVSKGQIGYELFDQGTLGMTDFMQKLNFKRALEGELARTVSNIRQVEMCRVHLVLPERSAFREAQTQPSASVVIQTTGGAQLTGPQIEGIAALVAGAVEGLSPADVSVLDTRGNLLSNPDAANPDATLTSHQLRMQRAVEQHLAQNGQSMLDQVLGPGDAIVRVTATLDFDRAVSEREIIDPESATVISEEKLEEQSDIDSANSSVRNYEMSRTHERSEKNPGDISYLTVSVILDYKKKPVVDGEEPEYVPHTETEVAEIESLVKNAVGFNPERNDRFAIHQTRFDTSIDDRMVEEMRQQRQDEQTQRYIRYGLLGLALLLGLWLLRSAGRRVSALTATPALEASQPLKAVPTSKSPPSLPEREPADGPDDDEQELVLIDDIYTSRLSTEAKAKLRAKNRMYEEVKKKVTTDPEQAAAQIRSWLIEDRQPA